MDFDVGVTMGFLMGFAAATVLWITLHYAARKS